MNKILFIVFTLTSLGGWWNGFSVVECFVPRVIINALLEAVDEQTILDFGKTSDSYSHDEILTRGVIRSVARYFYDKPDGKKKIKINKLERYEEDISKLYEDYYGRKILLIELEQLLKYEMEPKVASVDFDSDTKVDFFHEIMF